ncbi:MAG: hypothetical protein BRD37_01370 [Bacteroidetes bacterium QH_8_67_23]|nr:MAG: hypothetical protein BRD37_01370 [Bacteroidetes bacterium QH_8_67_23]
MSDARRDRATTVAASEAKRASTVPEQNEDGVDLTLVRQKLRMTPTERFEHMLGALRMQQELRRAGEEAFGP